jgi:hypothetical protein
MQAEARARIAALQAARAEARARHKEGAASDDIDDVEVEYRH